MCIDPGTIIVKEAKVLVQCRKCEECRAHQRRRLLGAVLAQQQTSRDVWFSTYTYGGGYENEQAYFLEYSDIQKMFKLLRRDGYRFKYLVAGEYGGELGRAHWHVLFLWESEPPPMPMGQRTSPEGDGYWPHGIVLHEKPRSKTGTAAYCMKYMEKAEDLKGGIKKSTGMGHDYLTNLAREHARNGLPLFPNKNTYIIREQKERSRSGQPFFYPIEKETAIYEKMMQAWLSEWAIVNPEVKLKHSELTREWYDECEEFPDHVWEFMNRTEGYDIPMEPCAVRELVITLRSEPLATVRCTMVGFTLNLADHKGNIVWQEPLRVGDAPALLRSGIARLPLAVTREALRVLRNKAHRVSLLRENNRRMTTMANPAEPPRPRKNPPPQKSNQEKHRPNKGLKADRGPAIAGT